MDPGYCTGIIVIVFLATVISCMFTIKKYHLLPKISLFYADAVQVKLMQSMIFLSFGNPAAVHDFSEILLMKWPYMKLITVCQAYSLVGVLDIGILVQLPLKC